MSDKHNLINEAEMNHESTMNVETMQKSYFGKTVRIVIAALTAIIGLITLFFCYYSFRFTQVSPDGTEVFIPIADNMLHQILVIVMSFLISLGLVALMKNQKIAKILPQVLLWVTLIGTAILGICWVTFAHIKPEWDQMEVYTYAGEIFSGNYQSLLEGGYYSKYPHQLGLATILCGLYQFFGVLRYDAFAYLNALYLPLLIFSGYRITKLLFHKEAITTVYLILVTACLPLYLYVPYIYGEIGSLAFSMAFLWQIVAFCRKPNWRSITFGALFATIAYMYRMNSIIVVIAGSIILLLFFVRKLQWRSFIFIGLTAILIFGSNFAMKEVYCQKAGLEQLQGVPRILYISMGLQESEMGPGWYNSYVHYVFLENDYNIEVSAEIGKNDIDKRMREFSADWKAAAGFFKRKIVSQWNEPTYDALAVTNSFELPEEEMMPMIVSIYRGELHDKVVNFMNRYQLIIYVFALIGCIVTFRRVREPEDGLIPLAILGGFLFSILWEAKSRYVLPYTVFMIPLAAFGMIFCAEKCLQLFSRKKTSVS